VGVCYFALRTSLNLFSITCKISGNDFTHQVNKFKAMIVVIVVIAVMLKVILSDYVHINFHYQFTFANLNVPANDF
jgi:hypothetical protein